MLGKELLAYVDHTLLRPTATWDDIKEVCEDGIRYKTASVCIPPDFVASAHEAYPELNICTVIGFPLGYETTEVKVAETKQAIEEGASEIDMVINIGALKDGNTDLVFNDIKAVVDAAAGKCVKVIIETCLLTDEEIVTVCKLAKEAQATFVKTSTGFSTGGATPEAVSLMKQTVGDDLEVKASGGVRTIEDMEKVVAAGATRIGTSAGCKLVKNNNS